MKEAMKVVVLAFGLFAVTGCVRATEGMVREQAAAAFGCADYALDVEEIGPDEYRAAGCGKELIYACRPTMRVSAAGVAQPRRTPAGEPAEVGNVGEESVMECARRPQ
jgi:hypothetical protein